MVGVDIGDHRDHRLQVQEAGVALVRLGDQVATAARLGIGAGSVQAAADDEGRVRPPAASCRNQQAGGGGLTQVGASRRRHGGSTSTRQHLGTGHHRDTPLQGGEPLPGWLALTALDTTSTSPARRSRHGDR